MATVLASSRRALASGSTAALLDVLAPAAFSTHFVRSRRRAHSASHVTNPGPVPSTSTAPASASNSDKPSRKQRQKARRESGEPPVRVQRGRPPASPRAPSAVDLLSQIRNTAPSAATSDPAIQQHNEAVLSIVRGTRDARRDYSQAFTQGWVPIRNAGQVARLQAKDLAKALRACSLAERNREPGYDWKQVKELALWLMGEKDMAGLVEWAWSSIELGPLGCQHVVEVWEAFMRGEHLALREGPAAINWAYQPTRGFAPTATPTPIPSKPPVFLFAAYVAAKSVSYRHSTTRPPFVALLPDLLDPTFPALQRWLNHPDAEKWINRAFAARVYDEDPDAFSSAVAWLRQVALAQIWYENPLQPGLALTQHVRGAFQRSAHQQVWELWFSLTQAIDNQEYRWISTEKWNSDTRQAWTSEEDDRAKAEESPVTSGPESITEHSAIPSTQVAPESTLPLRGVTLPALLTQSTVNAFLSGFVRARSLEQANELWAWLASRSPPLKPGIVTWTGLLTGYGQRGDLNAVENTWSDLIKSGTTPDLRAWLARIDAYFHAKESDEALRLSELMRADQDVQREVRNELGGRMPEVVGDKLISGLLSNGKPEDAEKLLADMEAAGSPPTIRAVNLFLKYYTRGNKPDLPAVVRMLKLVTERNLEADVYTYTTVLVALLQGGQQDATAKTIRIMEAARVKPTVTTYGAIISALTQSGNAEQLSAAVQVLEEMEGRKMPTNEIIYTSLIQGFLRAIPLTPLELDQASMNTDAQHPYLRAALTLKTRMERRGLSLNRIGFNSFLASALALRTDYGVELALRLYKEMKRRPGMISTLAAPAEDRADEAVPEGPGRGQNTTASDTYFILLDGFTKMKDWGRARAIVREMAANGFEVRNKGLKRLVDRLT